LWLSRSRPCTQTVQDFCDAALEGEFQTFDSQFHACCPTLQTCLESYLKGHQSSFVRIGPH
jgi:hypothetical protein